MKILRNPIFFIFFTLCAVIFSLSMFQSKNSNQLKTDLSDLEKQNAELEKKKIALEFEARVSEKKITQEKIIRDQLWRQKEGEIVLELKDFNKFVEMRAVAVAEAATAQKNITEGNKKDSFLAIKSLKQNSNWQAWWQVLKRKLI